MTVRGILSLAAATATGVGAVAGAVWLQQQAASPFSSEITSTGTVLTLTYPWLVLPDTSS